MMLFLFNNRSYVRLGPKANVNGGMSTLQASGLKNNESLTINVSNQLASARLQAIRAEKMSRELHVRPFNSSTFLLLLMKPFWFVSDERYLLVNAC